MRYRHSVPQNTQGRGIFAVTSLPMGPGKSTTPVKLYLIAMKWVA